MPDWKEIVRRRIAALRLTAAAESTLVDEIAQDLESRYNELTSGGMRDDEARRIVLQELADIEPLRADPAAHPLPRRDPPPPGDARPARFLEGLGRDLRYALRGMRRNPVFVVFVVLTLALGIGANTTVFTLVNTFFLNPLPVSDPGSLASVAGIATGAAARSSAPFPVSYADLKDYRDGNRAFQSLAGYTSVRMLTLRRGGAAEGIFGELVTGNYFATLGLQPARGRFFLPEEDGAPGARPVAVLSYGSWQMRLGAPPDVVGSVIRVNNLDLTIVGVAPPGFIGVNGIFGPDLWVPASMSELLLPNEMRNVLHDRAKAAFTGVGRLRPGVTRVQAQADLAGIAAGIARENPGANEGRGVQVATLRDILFGSGAAGGSPIVFAGAALLAVVGVVLLIACSNVANLLLARSAARQKEMAVRLAMGASRGRLARQVLTESVLLGLLGGALGLFLGYAGMQFLFGRLPTAANFIAPKLDATVFLYALAISLLTGLLFGALPAFRVSAGQVAETLKLESRTAGRSRGRVSVANALLVGQVALSFVLLLTAVLFLRSIGRAYAMDPGFDTAHLAVFMMSPGSVGYTEPQAKAFYLDTRRRMAALPGVQSVSWASNLPLWSRAADGVAVEGRAQRSRADTIRSIVTTVDLDYFPAAGVAVLAGRPFSAADRETTRPVAIVNEKMARDYWPDGALGRRVRLPGENRPREIVGVARTANYTAWGEPPQPCVYIPLEQHYVDALTLYVRVQGDPRQILAPVQREIHAAAPSILIASVRTGPEIVDGGLFQAKMGVGLLTVFGLLALGLASIGLYGILAYSVNQRTREIGLRMALGAGRRGVLALVLKQGMTLVAAGLAIGAAVSLFSGRLVSRLLFGVSPTDPLSAAAAAVVLAAVALVACYLPARRATRVDPLDALRET